MYHIISHGFDFRSKQIDTEMLEDRRFVVKVSCSGGIRAAARAAQAVESLGLEITYGSIEQIGPEEVLHTAFIKVSSSNLLSLLGSMLSPKVSNKT